MGQCQKYFQLVSKIYCENVHLRIQIFQSLGAKSIIVFFTHQIVLTINYSFFTKYSMLNSTHNFLWQLWRGEGVPPETPTDKVRSIPRR
jgi:hypothetical protein